MVKYLLMISLMTIGIFSGCKRYEEDPFTLSTPEKRLRGSSWRLVSYTVNGVDSIILIV